MIRQVGGAHEPRQRTVENTASTRTADSREQRALHQRGARRRQSDDLSLGDRLIGRSASFAAVKSTPKVPIRRVQ